MFYKGNIYFVFCLIISKSISIYSYEAKYKKSLVGRLNSYITLLPFFDAYPLLSSFNSERVFMRRTYVILKIEMSFWLNGIMILKASDTKSWIKQREKICKRFIYIQYNYKLISEFSITWRNYVCRLNFL